MHLITSSTVTCEVLQCATSGSSVASSNMPEDRDNSESDGSSDDSSDNSSEHLVDGHVQTSATSSEFKFSWTWASVTVATVTDRIRAAAD